MAIAIIMGIIMGMDKAVNTITPQKQQNKKAPYVMYGAFFKLLYSLQTKYKL